MSDHCSQDVEPYLIASVVTILLDIYCGYAHMVLQCNLDDIFLIVWF